MSSRLLDLEVVQFWRVLSLVGLMGSAQRDTCIGTRPSDLGPFKTVESSACSARDGKKIKRKGPAQA